MNLKKLAEKARQQADKAIEQRGGTDALKADASQVADALKGPGKLSDKAKRAAEAVKKPG
jgi:methyl-accepting chemotaxis protein